MSLERGQFDIQLEKKIEDNEMELLQAQIEVYEKENEIYRKKNKVLAEQNSHLKEEVTFLENNLKQVSESSHRHRTESDAWYKDNIRLAKKQNQKLMDLLDFLLTSEDEKINNQEYKELEEQELTVAHEHQFNPELYAFEKKEDPKFLELREQVLMLQEKVKANQENVGRHKEDVNQELIQEKNELEKIIQEKIATLFSQHKKEQTLTFQEMQNTFTASFAEIKESKDFNTLAGDIKGLELVIAGQEKSLANATKLISEQSKQQIQSDLNQVRQEVISKIKSIEDLLESDNVKNKVQQLQETLFAEIQKEQEVTENIFKHLNLIENKQGLLEKQQEPMYEIYRAEKTKLDEQKIILGNDKQRLFYNTVYKVLSAKFIAAIVISTGLIKSEDKLTNELGNFGASAISAALSFVPLVGGVLSTIAQYAIDKTVNGIKGKIQSKKAERTTDTLITLDQAMAMAELIARRVTQRHIQSDCNIVNDLIEKSAIACSRFIYNYIKTGSLLAHKNLSADKKSILLSNLVEEKKVIPRLMGLTIPEDSKLDVLELKALADEDSKLEDEYKRAKRKKRPGSQRIIIRPDNDTIRKAAKQAQAKAELTSTHTAIQVGRLKSQVAKVEEEKRVLNALVEQQGNELKKQRTETDSLREEMAKIQSLVVRLTLQMQSPTANMSTSPSGSGFSSSSPRTPLSSSPGSPSLHSQTNASPIPIPAKKSRPKSFYGLFHGSSSSPNSSSSPITPPESDEKLNRLRSNSARQLILPGGATIHAKTKIK